MTPRPRGHFLHDPPVTPTRRRHCQSGPPGPEDLGPPHPSDSADHSWASPPYRRLGRDLAVPHPAPTGLHSGTSQHVLRGSSASRNPSPTRLIASTTKTRTDPDHRRAGEVVTGRRSALGPSSAWAAGAGVPRKLKAASAMMGCFPKLKLVCTTTGPRACSAARAPAVRPVSRARGYRCGDVLLFAGREHAHAHQANTAECTQCPGRSDVGAECGDQRHRQEHRRERKDGVGLAARVSNCPRRRCPESTPSTRPPVKAMLTAIAPTRSEIRLP